MPCARRGWTTQQILCKQTACARGTRLGRGLGASGGRGPRLAVHGYWGVLLQILQRRCFQGAGRPRRAWCSAGKGASCSACRHRQHLKYVCVCVGGVCVCVCVCVCMSARVGSHVRKRDRMRCWSVCTHTFSCARTYAHTRTHTRKAEGCCFAEGTPVVESMSASTILKY